MGDDTIGQPPQWKGGKCLNLRQYTWRKFCSQVQRFWVQVCNKQMPCQYLKFSIFLCRRIYSFDAVCTAMWLSCYDGMYLLACQYLVLGKPWASHVCLWLQMSDKVIIFRIILIIFRMYRMRHTLCSQKRSTKHEIMCIFNTIRSILQLLIFYPAPNLLTLHMPQWNNHNKSGINRKANKQAFLWYLIWQISMWLNKYNQSRVALLLTCIPLFLVFQLFNNSDGSTMCDEVTTFGYFNCKDCLTSTEWVKRNSGVAKLFFSLCRGISLTSWLSRYMIWYTYYIRYKSKQWIINQINIQLPLHIPLKSCQSLSYPNNIDWFCIKYKLL